ncbi:MAG: tetratricopeptide repeat protein [Myxococcales bacterium]|nr:tetratricopeptide repeat protein [Myxococcales bacterium]HIK86212.1 tetratricopeptide repeat protein [Myxococcales bacterium]
MRWRRNQGAAAASQIELAWRRALRAAIDGNWPRAETWLERIVEANSKNIDAYLALARLYRNHGAIGRAIRMHQNLLLRSELNRSERAEALLELGRDFEEGGFHSRAAATFEELLGLDSGNAEILERLISLLLALGEFSRGLSLVKRLRRRNREAGDRLEVALLLAQSDAQIESGDHDGARRSIKRCLRRNKSCGRAWLRLGELEAERGKTNRALEAWKHGAETDQEAAAEIYPKLAATFAAKDKAEAFDAFLLKLLDRRPEDHSARIALARVRRSRGDSASAIEELARAVEITPEELSLRSELGRQLIAAGQDSEALKAYAGLLELIDRLSSPLNDIDEEVGH